MSETQRNRPSFPWQVRLAEALTVLLVAAGTRRDGTVRRRVLSLLDFRAPPNPVPVDGVATSDHVVDPARNLSVRIFAPPRGESPVPTVFYFHGGGFVFNSAFSYPYDAFCRRLARQIPARVVSVDYRLAPEHRFPAAYDDCFDAVAWLDDYILASSAAGDAPATAVFLAGESAGGNIAHHVARRMLASSSFRSLTPAGVVAVQPFFGGEEETESERRLEGVPMGSRERYKWMWRSFLPEGSSLDHEAANVFGPGSDSGDGDWTGFPPTMVVVGVMDTLQDWQRWYCEGLRRAGVEVCVREYGNAIHAFQFFKNLPEAEQMLVDVADFVREVVGNG